jgi:hypothetical protein
MFAASKTDSVSTGDYQISRSLRINSADNAILTRTPATATNRKTWTWSAWIKRGLMSASNIAVFSSANAQDYLQFGSDYSLTVSAYNNINYFVATTQLFRDPSAWYHIVVGFDSTQATASNRIKLYVNGVQITAFQTANYPTQNLDTDINNTVVQYIGTNTYNYFNGYMTEVNFIDGQQLTPSSFGETNAQTGVWQPKAFAGTYGTNGYYLNFSDNSNTTAATLGKDYSGNGNNWTPNNFSVSAGAGNDSMVDVPTPYGVDTGAGGSVRGNYCTFNPLDKNPSLVVTNGNLDVTENTSNWINGRCTFGMSSGKWYVESTLTAGLFQVFGIANSLTINTGYSEGSVVGNWAYATDGAKIVNGSYSPPYGATYTTNDVIGMAFDADAGTLTMYKNGVSQGVLVSGLPANTYFPWVALNSYASSGGFATVSLNFGQRPFAYTAPSGFKALCTQNLPTPTIGATTATQAGKFFNPVLYTGNNSTQSITGVGFQPDFIWIKYRPNSGTSHTLVNAVTGNTKYLFSSTNAAEETVSDAVTSFNSDGFSLGANNSGVLPFVNYSLGSYVAWNWKASNATAVSNTAGSITSTVSANTTSGFSVVTWTNPASGVFTFGHGLGVAPSMVILKDRQNVVGWTVYHIGIGNTGAVFLNTDGAVSTSSGYFNNTSPTSTVFTANQAGVGNANANMVAYCFAPIAGYSAFGSYTGNGSTDGPFVYCGFRPAYVMMKSTSASDWYVFDVARNPYNVTEAVLYPNDSAAEGTFSTRYFDILSNGFKMRTTASPNASANYIFMAFASAPFKYSLAR